MINKIILTIYIILAKRIYVYVKGGTKFYGYIRMSYDTKHANRVKSHFNFK